ncbi:hypothetical protein SAMN04490185_4158 [Pseudomonas frederiksbergensis]|uniref:Uncharacterized protein n=1 Tax=Pseudomonas frederiksbergensis TaxID=104087 RepID=A0A1H5DEL0_9PSED|nr:hypothetical protein [Pseudomonas frederiksbergensis]SED77281.1 hypothetical protein SAMN04490185_4158 [Pseudomonas frederiksbergensis]
MTTKKTEQAEADTALKTLDLLQELIWAIRSRESTELSEGVSYLRNLAYHEKTARRKPERKASQRDKQSDLKALVGSMSLVLADIELFPANEDIAKFALEALQIKIARWEKRSRYEMIGMLIMESINASPERLRDVGNLLNKISDESDSMEIIKQSSRQTGFSWNEAIRSLWTSVE